MLIPVEIASFAVDAASGGPLIILKETGGVRTLPVAIGPYEASAIAIKSLKVTSERPLTIDLTKALMEQLGGVLDKVVIHDVSEQTLFARLYIFRGNNLHLVDSRPCDAIALAMRCETPVFVEDAIFEKTSEDGALSEDEKLRSTIAGIDTLSFGSYYLE
ncbi:MAG: bifunctional nuclease family protein [Chitinivibrionales bacterium]|nr:bifunctional nuclease family protein [Chitinivibrionales bacterium]